MRRSVNNLFLVILLLTLSVPLFSMGSGEDGLVSEVNEQYYKKQIFDFSTNEEFKSINEIPVIIDFYAEWCGPCKMLAPVMEDLAKEYKGKVKFLKVNAEKESRLAGFHGVRSYPTIFFIPAHAEAGDAGMLSGFLDQQQLTGIIEDIFFNSEGENNEEK